MSSKTAHIPSIARLVEILDGQQLYADDLRHLHRVKNWLRDRHESKTHVSAAKVNPQIHKSQARGIAI